MHLQHKVLPVKVKRSKKAACIISADVKMLSVCVCVFAASSPVCVPAVRPEPTVCCCRWIWAEEGWAEQMTSVNRLK